ncbi:MAG TPA: EthD domain-containing protein [Ilumatobacteraceae bacterium]|nr:EthD domain-containing protein [Ilumatobacteraceae bacterium]
MFAALGRDRSAAIEVARSIGGLALVAVDDQPTDRPFEALVIGAGQSDVVQVADIGLYRVTVRPMRHQRRSWPPATATPGVTAVFPMVRRPDLTHAQADAHWRDIHAPLALRHHPGMWHYVQVSVDEVVTGPAYDGIALCAFASEQERRERFFGGPEDRAVIGADVATFADVAASPRHVRMTEWRFGAEEPDGRGAPPSSSRDPRPATT